MSKSKKRTAHFSPCEESGMMHRDDDEDRYLEKLLEMRGGTEKDFRELFEEVHRAILAEAAEKKRTLQ